MVKPQTKLLTNSHEDVKRETAINQ